jgi:uncharacterized membrane protein HdeD (DUF308 family)
MNFKKWAFRFLIYIIILNIIIYYMVINFASGFDDPEKLNQNLTLTSIIGILLLLAGIVFISMSLIKKEEKNYQYYISIIGYPIIIILTLSSLF